MIYAGVSNGQTFGYFLVACLGSAGHFAWQLWSWNPNVPEDGGAKFQVRCSYPPCCVHLHSPLTLQSNGVTGLLIWMGMLLDYWLVHSS